MADKKIAKLEDRDMKRIIRFVFSLLKRLSCKEVDAIDAIMIDHVGRHDEP